MLSFKANPEYSKDVQTALERYHEYSKEISVQHKGCPVHWKIIL